MPLLGEMMRAGDPSRPVIVAPGEDAELSRGQLLALATRLRELAQPGECVALDLESRLGQAALVVAGLLAGILVCPLNPASPAVAKSTVLGHAQPRTIIRDTALLADLHAGPAPVPSSKGGLLVYTSGSTGNPKGVHLDEAMIGANVAFAIRHFGHETGAVAGSILPLFHTFTLVSDVLPMLACGGQVVVTPGFAVAQLPAASRALVDHRVHTYSGVPIVFDMMLAMRVPLPSSMRFAIAGAAALGERTRLRYAERHGHPILPCYGLTETTCFATASAPGQVRAGTVGRAADIEVAILDEAGQPLPTGVDGEIAHRGASVIRGGYFRDGGQHEAAFTADGWFLSGDMGRKDAEGFVTLTGRKKNMLVRGGKKVYLEDVDRVLLDDPAVQDACCVRVDGPGPHEERAVAYVVARDTPPDPVALAHRVTAALGLIARIDDIAFLDEIPRTATGKPRRELLLARYREGR